MANDCLAQVQACAMRVTRLDSNGVPRPGANNMYVSDALISLGFTLVAEAGDEITDKNACGATIVNYKAADSIRRGDIAIQLITPDPQLSELLSGGTVLTSGARVGFAGPDLGQVSADAVSIEVWARRIRDGRLDDTYPYAWWVYPWVTNLRPNEHTHENASIKPTFVGEALENANWYNGPLNDWPVASDKVYQWMPTATIPTTQCGYLTLAAS